MTEGISLKTWVRELEDEFGQGLYRRIKVIRDGDSKRPIWDMNTMSVEDVLNPKYEYKPKGKAPYKASGRGFKDSDDWTDYSLFVKHIPEIYCVDIDTHNVDDMSLYDLLESHDAYKTKTKKGYHFYIRVKDMPEYTNEVDVAKVGEGLAEKPSDIDFIKFTNNIWENRSRKVYGSHFAEIGVRELENHLDFYEMNVEGAKDKKEHKLKVPDEDEDMPPIKYSDITTITEKQHKGYIDRITKNRYSYKYWIGVGFIIYMNFQGEEEGFNMWRDWSKKDALIETRNNKRKFDFMYKKWSSMSKEKSSLTWKTLRMWANEDTPINEFEAAYLEGGEDALTKYMNEFTMYCDATSEYLYELRDKRGTWVLKKAAQMKDKFARYKFFIEDDGQKFKVNPYVMWNENISRRDINRIVFDPSGTEDNVFNLWKGYKISKTDADKFDEKLAQPLLDHIKNIWCRGREDHYEYVMSWLAWIIQRPHIKIGVLLALKSDEGAGKGVVMEHLKRIMGHHFSETSESGNVLGDFNSGLEAKVLIDLDEAFWGGDKKIEGTLKHLITQTQVSINKKCKEPYEIDNTTAFMITTNNMRFLPADKGSRRYLCLDLDGKYAGVETAETKAYFDEVRGCPTGAFARVLYNWDIKQFRPRCVPKTELLQDQIEQSWNTITKWWFQTIKDGYFNYISGAGHKKKLKWGDIDYCARNGRKVVKQIKTKMLDKPTMEMVKNKDGEWKKDSAGQFVHEQARDKNGELIFKCKNTEQVVETGYFKDWLYQHYKDTPIGWGTKVEKNIFGKELVKLMGEYYKTRKITDKVGVGGEHKKGNRVEILVMPSLDIVREEFNKNQNWNYEWDTTDGGAEYLDADGELVDGYGILDDGSSSNDE